MKTGYGIDARRIAAVVMCACLATVAGQMQADVVTLTDGNSTAVFDSVTGGGGLTQWTVDGAGCLGFEGLWIALPGQAESQLTVASVVPIGSNKFAATHVYTSGAVNVTVGLIGELNGGGAGSGVSGFTEMITVMSPTATPVRLLQFCDFGTLAGLEQAEVKNDNSLIELDAVHEGSVAAAPGASHYQIGPAADLRAGLNDGAVTVLTDDAGPVVGNDLAWMVQWDLVLPGNNVPVLISRPKVVGPAASTIIIPEPCTMSVMALASAALLARRRRKAYVV